MSSGKDPLVKYTSFNESAIDILCLGSHKSILDNKLTASLSFPAKSLESDSLSSGALAKGKKSGSFEAPG